MSAEAYRDQLRRFTAAISKAQLTSVQDALADDSTAELAKVFADGNLDKRCDKLLDQLEFLEPVFPDWEATVIHYVKEVPSAAYDSVITDADRLLAWLETWQPLSPLQQDYVTCQRARHRVDQLARRCRMKFLAFQQRWQATQHEALHLMEQPDTTILLNPIRTWARFVTTDLLDDEATAPADVLFFAAAEEVATAYLELEGEVLVNELADYQPCTLDQWLALSRLADREALTGLCQSLVVMGLVVFEPAKILNR